MHVCRVRYVTDCDSLGLFWRAYSTHWKSVVILVKASRSEAFEILAEKIEQVVTARHRDVEELGGK